MTTLKLNDTGDDKGQRAWVRFIWDGNRAEHVNTFVQRAEWSVPTFAMRDGVYQVHDPSARPAMYGAHVIRGTANKFNIRLLSKVLEDVSGLPASTFYPQRKKPKTETVGDTTQALDVFDTPQPCSRCGSSQVVLYLPENTCNLCTSGDDDDN